MLIHKPEFKEKFIERYSKLTDFELFKKYSLTYLRKSIRVNTLKISVEELKTRLKDFKLEPIKWCKEGFFVSGSRTDLGNLLEHKLGYFYVQEAVSMIPSIVLNPKQTDLIFDMTASPGSKTTHLAVLMKNRGLMIANDIKHDRIKALSSNLQRCGVLNTVITLQDAGTFDDLNSDKILLDAPCSATGAIRKSLKTIEMWNPNTIKRIAGLQRYLVRSAFRNLKNNGTLVYSTCSLEPEENEGIVNYILENYNAKVEKIDLDIRRSEPILEFENKVYDKQIKNCLRIWPQDNDTEGFFVAKIKKLE